MKNKTFYTTMFKSSWFWYWGTLAIFVLTDIFSNSQSTQEEEETTYFLPGAAGIQQEK